MLVCMRTSLHLPDELLREAHARIAARPDIYVDHVFGEQLEWSFATPWVYRALASPMTHEPILKASSATEPGSPPSPSRRGG